MRQPVESTLLIDKVLFFSHPVEIPVQLYIKPNLDWDLFLCSLSVSLTFKIVFLTIRGKALAGAGKARCPHILGQGGWP